MLTALVEQLQGYSAKVLAVALLAAALAKLTDVAAFRNTVRMLGLGRLTGPVSLAVPVVEALLGIGFAAAILRSYVAAAAALLFAVFAIVALLTIHSGKRIRCSCFGNSESRLGWSTVAANVFLIALAWFAARGPSAPGAVLAEVWLWLGAAAVVTMAAVCGHVMSNWKNIGVPASD